MPQEPNLYIGLMSGTSVDGIDLVLAEFTGNHCQFIASACYSFAPSVQSKIHTLSTPLVPPQLADHRAKASSVVENRIEQMAQLDYQLGCVFGDAINQFIVDKKIPKNQVKAIGCHGQTIRHRPNQTHPFTLQIGDPNIIAERTGLLTVADFRRADMAAGGQGAPLVPAFHDQVLRSRLENRIILNLGGIANITLLPKTIEQPILGFDTGPANTLLDAHFKRHHPQQHFDENGRFARQGEVDDSVLAALLADPYFIQPPPKSTGREYFNLYWLQSVLDRVNYPLAPESIQATLLELTVQTIDDGINQLGLSDYQVYGCGGGMHNQFLLDRLASKQGKPIQTTNQIGVDGDSLEAMTFAWLAYRRLASLPGSLTSVTGARRAKVLGAIYHP